jgi:hypothetical protein
LILSQVAHPDQGIYVRSVHQNSNRSIPFPTPLTMEADPIGRGRSRLAIRRRGLLEGWTATAVARRAR